MEDILAQAKKAAEAAEVFMVSSEETPVQFEANRLKRIQSKQGTSVALRIIKGGRIGYASTTDLTDIQRLVANAAETAQFGVKAGFELPAKAKYPEIDIFDPDTESISLERMIAVGEETGAIDHMLIKVAEAYEREVDDTVNALASLLEPLMIVFLGVIIGTIVVALYLPLFNIATIIK